MFECLVAFLFNEHLDAASYDETAAPGYRRLLNAHRKPHATADGWLAVMPYSEEDWCGLLGELGREDLLQSEWFSSAAGRNAHSALLYEALSEGLPRRTMAYWTACLDRLDIPYSEVNSLQSLLSHPHLLAKDFFRRRDDLPGRVRSVPQPMGFSVDEVAPDRGAPAKGADTRAVLIEFGFGEEEIESLLANGGGG